jgi:hypothetical protein
MHSSPHGCDALGEFALGRLIVTVRENTAPVQVEELARSHSARVESLGETHWLFHFPEGADIEGKIPLLLIIPFVRFAELDRVVRIPEWEGKEEEGDNPAPLLVTNDPLIPKQWHLNACNVKPCWDVTTGEGIYVGIIDTGISYTHPDLIVDQEKSWNYYAGTADARDDNGHGTCVGGVVAMVLNNAKGGAGISPSAILVAFKVADSTGLGYWSKIVASINAAMGKGVRVLNASFGDLLNAGSILSAAAAYKAKGGILCIAGGNTGNDPGYTPSDSVITVVGTNQSNVRWSSSSYGPWANIAAPAVSICSSLMSGGYTYSASGTSFASPIVAGAVALIMTASKLLTSKQIEEVLYATATPISSAGMGSGKLNAWKAVTHAQEFNPNPPIEPPIEPPVEPPPIDITAPTVTISAPDTISGNVTVSMASSESAALEILINGKIRATGTGRALKFQWNTRKEAKGNHLILARATDSASPPNIGQAEKTVVKS